jgi:alkylhydroperoxidase family enzyme
MSRIDAPQKPNPLTRLTWRIAKRKAGGDRVPEPVAIQSHHPSLQRGYSMFELAFQRSNKVPEKLKMLAELKAGAVCGCEWCMDYGSWLARGEGISEEQLRAMPSFRESDLFDEEEKLVLEYAEGISRTPVHVPDELFARLRERFDEPQIVELTFAAGIENLRARVNWALGIGSQGYSEGAFCVRPEGAQPREAAAQSV